MEINIIEPTQEQRDKEHQIYKDKAKEMGIRDEASFFFGCGFGESVAYERSAARIKELEQQVVRLKDEVRDLKIELKDSQRPGLWDQGQTPTDSDY